ncbi:hypothetical protein UFOVP1672_84, partial [uncultured Caudovirales phage]
MSKSTGKLHGEINYITDTQAAYIAGMIDADGTVTVGQGTTHLPQPMVLVVNTNYELIDWLKAVVGAGCAY